MRVLVLGANGFIGSHVAASLFAEGRTVRAGARRPGPALRRAPAFEWVEADFARLARADDWAPLLAGVDAVVNCVGVLQDGGGDSTEAAHVTGPRALIAACEAAGVRRFVHVSAVGADDEAGTAYARSKRATETMLEASALDWAILRPSLVVASAAFGGTALVRGVAALPFFTPMVGGGRRFRPVTMPDLCAAISALLPPTAPACVRLDVAGPQAVTLAELLRAYRGWLGSKPAPVVSLPPALAAPVLRIGDLLGRLGWPSALRTTSLAQMNHDVEGDPDGWTAALGLRPRTLDAWLCERPATVQDVWHARLYFLRPAAIAALAVFWILSGAIALGPGRDAAEAILRQAGFGGAAGAVNAFFAAVDVALGAALLVRRWTARAAVGMALVAAGYLAAGTALLPSYWADPLGPWLKTLPGLVLALVVAATDERR